MIELNLLPKELRKKRKKRSVQMPTVPAIPIAIIVLAVLICVHAALIVMVMNSTGLSSELTKKWEEMKPQREKTEKMIREIKGFKVLAGARGRATADIDAIADVLVKVSHMAVVLEDQVKELDINPLLVLPEGQGVRVADALVIKK